MIFPRGLPLALASSSPRRTEILAMLGIPFRAVEHGFVEILPRDVPPERASEYFAAQKAAAAGKKIAAERRAEFACALAADTAIVLDGRLYGKPCDAREAESFLRDFSGKTHAVYSSVALLIFDDSPNFTIKTRANKTDVTFKELSGEEITRYTAAGEWRGAAGGYRIQERGAVFISRINGSPSAVAGLPVCELCELFTECGFPPIL